MENQRIPLSAQDEAVYLETFIAEPIRIKNQRRKALLIIPGGGYGGVSADREGEPVAMAFMPHGFNAFVLHYTVGGKKPFPAQLIETALAIKHIKDHAKEYHIDPEQLFVVGFSAGGHLAACTSVLWKHPAIYQAVDMPYGYNKPRGTMLIYPVLSPDYHEISFVNLWATPTPTQEQRNAVSIEKLVDQDSAPAFILHTANDPVVNVRNSLALAWALANIGHSFELHVYPDGPHGLSLANELTAMENPAFINPTIAKWIDHAVTWCQSLEQ